MRGSAGERRSVACLRPTRCELADNLEFGLVCRRPIPCGRQRRGVGICRV